MVLAVQAKLALTHTPVPEPKEDSSFEATSLSNNDFLALSIVQLGVTFNALLPLTCLTPCLGRWFQDVVCLQPEGVQAYIHAPYSPKPKEIKVQDKESVTVLKV